MHLIRFAQSLLIAVPFLLSAGCQTTGVSHSVAIADKQARVAVAREKHGAFYADRVASFIDDAAKRAPGGTIFLGDSITSMFPLEEAFPGKNVMNRGIGGDTIGGLVDRLDVSVANAAPAKIYVCIGSNDVTGEPSTPKALAHESFEQLLRDLKRIAPQAKIAVFSLFPVGHRITQWNPRMHELSEEMRAICADEKIEFIDVGRGVVDADGELRADFTPDGDHITIAGYVAWLEAFVPKNEFFDTACGIAPLWAKTHAQSHSVDKVDPPFTGEFPGSRGPDQLILYTPAYGHPSSGTNPWGSEAQIKNGVVIAKTDFDTPIPPEGFVVSGHGKAAMWVSTNLRPGVPVAVVGNELVLQPIPSGQLSSGDRLLELQSRTFNVLAQIIANRKSPEARNLARALVEKIYSQKVTYSLPTEDFLKDVEQDLKALE